MNFKRLASALFAIAALGSTAVGCTIEDASTDAESDDLEARHDMEIVPTVESGLQLLGGYSYVFDLGATDQPCVHWSGKPQIQATDLTTSVSIDYVSSLSKLEEVLGIDTTLGVKVDPIASGSVTAKYTHSLTTTDNRYSYLLVAQQRYTVLAAGSVAMTGDRPADADGFIMRCGDSYVKGLTYAATLRVLMDIDAPTRAEADQIAAGVTASASKGLPKAKVDGNLAANVTSGKTSSSSQFKIRYALEAKGFDPSKAQTVLPTSTDGTGVADAIAGLTANYLPLLAASATADLAADIAGTGTNPARNAIPVEVHRGWYSHAHGFTQKPSPFKIINERTGRARDFLDKFGYLNAQINDVYYDEIQRFLSATGSNKSHYNVAPPGKPLPNAGALTAVAAAAEQVFRPTGGSSILTKNATGGLRFRIHSCLESAREPNFTACVDDAAKTPEYKKALDALDAYAAASRILPVDFTTAGEHVYYHGDCDDVAGGGNGFQLANAAQIEQLAPVVAASPHACAWYDDQSGKACGSWSQPYFTSTSSEPASAIDGGFQCSSTANLWRSCAILCVPPEGPFGTPVALGRGSQP